MGGLMLRTALVLASVAAAAVSAQSDAGRESSTLPTLRVASIISTPFLQRRADEEAAALTGNNRFEGFIKDLLLKIAKTLDFKFRIILSEDGKYGVRDPSTGAWSGMIGMLTSDRVDLIAADLTLTYTRQEVLDFSRPFMSAPLTILARKSVPADADVIFDFFSPFTWDVWLLLFASFLLTSWVFWVCARLSPAERWPAAVPVFCGCRNAFWHVFACFFRGSNFAPKAISTRFLIACWWIFCVAFLLAYVIVLKAFLEGCVSSLLPVKSASSLTALLDNPAFRFGVIEGGASHEFLQKSGSELHRRMYERIAENPDQSLIASYTDGIARLVDGEDDAFGLVIEGNVADHMTRKHCALYTVGKLQERFYAFAFPKGSRYQSLFSGALMRLEESGELQALKDTWWSSSAACPDAGGEREGQAASPPAAALGLVQMAAPFVFLLMALVVALIIAFLELLRGAWTTPDSRPKGQRIAADVKWALCGAFNRSADPHRPTATTHSQTT